MVLLIVSLLGSTINIGLLFYGFEFTTALDASFISATSPIFVVAASYLFLKEQITKKEKVGLAIAFLGTLLITLEPLINGSFLSFENIKGNVLIILANFSWVLYVIFSKDQLKHKISPLLITTYMFVVGFLSLIPLAYYQAGSVTNLFLWIYSAPIKSHMGVWYMAFLSGALAYFLYQKGQKSIEASEAALFGYLSPLFAAPLAVFWLGEKITATFMLGAIVIAIGVFLAEYKGRLKKL